MASVMAFDVARSWLTQALTALIGGLAYWQIVVLASGAREPWDASNYWTVLYPLAILICAGLGYAFRRRAWLTGGLFVFAQLPVMVAHAGTGPLIWAGLLLLALLSIPAGVAAWLAGRFRDRIDAT